MEMEKRFDEGFDNILTYDYDREYQEGKQLCSDSLAKAYDRATVSLNGQWHFSPDVFHSVVRSRWFEETKFNRDGLAIPYDFSFHEWETVTVPGVWNDQKKEYALYEGPGLYFREFSYERKEDRRVFLNIGAANYETRIWLNKKYLGRHLGGFTPFSAEVTELLEDRNRLLICVDNTRKGQQVPSAHYDWFNYGGIHRDVELLEVPRIFIRDFHIQLSRKQTGRLEYDVTVDGGPMEITPEVMAVYLKIEELGLNERLVLRSRKHGLFQVSGFIQVDESRIQLWSPEHPYLYSVEVGSKWNADGTKGTEDMIADRIGFRRIDTEGTDILLNGKTVFLKGMCVHEESPVHLRAVTVEDIRKTLETAKELGCNFLRLTHYPHREQTARLADRLGIMLWEEIPVYWALEFDNPKTFSDASNQLSELILRDRNRASVIIWSVGNENPDTDARYHFMEKLVERAGDLDKNRLISASCLIDVELCRIKDRLISKLDVVGINEYYGWYIKDFSLLEKILDQYGEGKPLIITETGADAVCGTFGPEDEIYTEECQASVYQKQFDILFRYSFVRGITPWILFDYRSMRRISCLQKGFNLKGIIGSDWIYKKKAYQVVKAAYSRKGEG